jgi:NAD(P)-dependent dehydrogenase (short-subunit alcohol dehydrogenase family)
LRSQGRGTIAKVASIAGIRPRAGQVWYSNLKAIVIGLTRAMGSEFGPDGLRVNAICPEFTPTPPVR